ncbi:MAG: WD40/YVTN/BNR-like repeat-containing protein [Candidatus Dormibacteria bacterium]
MRSAPEDPQPLTEMDLAFLRIVQGAEAWPESLSPGNPGPAAPSPPGRRGRRPGSVAVVIAAVALPIVAVGTVWLSSRTSTVATPPIAAQDGLSPAPLAASTAPSSPAASRKPGKLAGSPNLTSLGNGVLVAVSGAHLLVSIDGGATWTSRALPSADGGVAVDPTDQKRAVTGGSTITLTTDGTTWLPTSAPPPNPASYLPLLISPLDPKVWYFAHNGSLLRTRDAGVSWKDLSVPVASPVSLVIAGGSANQYFVGGGEHVLEVDNTTATLTDLGKPSISSRVVGLAFGSGPPALLVARTEDHRAYIHANGGWELVSAGFGGPVLVTGTGTVLVADGMGRAGQGGGVDRSTDGGATWGAARGLPSDQSVDALAANADASHIYAYTYAGDIYRSDDGGANWALVGPGLSAAG